MKRIIVLSGILFSLASYAGLFAHDDHDKDKEDTTKTDSVKMDVSYNEDTLRNQNSDTNKEVTVHLMNFRIYTL